MDDLDALLADLQTTVAAGDGAIDATTSAASAATTVPRSFTSSGQVMPEAIPSNVRAATSNQVTNSPLSKLRQNQDGQRSKVSQTLNSSLNELDTLLDELSSSQFVDKIRDTKPSGSKTNLMVQQLEQKRNQRVEAKGSPSSKTGSTSNVATPQTGSSSSLNSNHDYSRVVKPSERGAVPGDPDQVEIPEPDVVVMRGPQKTANQSEIIEAAADENSSRISVGSAAKLEPSLVAEKVLNSIQNARVSAEIPAADFNTATGTAASNDSTTGSAITSPNVDENATPLIKSTDDDANRRKEEELDKLLSELNVSMTGAKAGHTAPSAPLCGGCNKPITDGQLLTALNRTWHPNHFACSQCEDALGTSSFYERNGKPYCEACYIQLYSARCAKCLEPIVDRCVTAMNKTWHVEHFACAACGCLFDSIGFLVHDDKPYCPTDYYELFSTRCVDCRQPITGRFVTALNGTWHPDCFVCRECRKPFNDGIFNELDGAPYCTPHYNARRGAQCATCGKPISGRCVAALFRKYHPECFRCAFCSSVLNRGVFKEHEDRPYCNDCFGKFIAVLRD